MRRLEHIGIAADNMDGVLTVCRDVLGREPYKTESVESEGVRTHFFDAGSAKLEFLESTAVGSPIGTFLEKRGPGMHHLAFEVDDLEGEVARLSGLGYRLLGQPRGGADGKRIIFLHPKDTAGVLVELCQQRGYPESAPVAEAIFAVDPNEESSPLAAALGRFGGVVRGDFSPTGAAGCVSVSPGKGWLNSALSAPNGVVVLTAPLDTELPAGWLRFGLDVSGEVCLPRAIWKGLADPWGLVAAVVAGHLKA